MLTDCLDELSEKLEKIVARKHFGVVTSLIAAVGKVGDGEKRLVKVNRRFLTRQSLFRCAFSDFDGMFQVRDTEKDSTISCASYFVS